MQNGYDFIQANITLSTLPGFNLLVAIRANFKHRVILFTITD